MKQVLSTPALQTPPYYGHLAITDTPLLRTPPYYGTSLLRTKEKSPAETIKKYMKQLPL